MKALWQDPAFQDIAGQALRPGGLALTEQALTFCKSAKLLPAKGYAADMGSGLGASLTLLAAFGFTAVGLDLSRAKSPSIPQTSPHALRIIADIRKPPLAKGRFALLLFECVLSLLAEPDQALFWARELMGPKGICLVSDLQGQPQAGENSCLAGARTRTDWERLFRQQGLEVLHYEDHSQELRALAAKLCWYGYDLGVSCSGHAALGYGLWILGHSSNEL